MPCRTYLAQNGLFRHLSTCFPSLGGHYTTLHVMTLLGYMALCRIKTVEQLQYQPPGELGNRSAWTACRRSVPGPRYKLTSLSAGRAANLGRLAVPRFGWKPIRSWREPCTWTATCGCITASLRNSRPGTRRVISCACAARRITGPATCWASPSSSSSGPSTTVCWKCCGMRWRRGCWKRFPINQRSKNWTPTRYGHRFVLLFDREGYSPEFFKEMWQNHRIACVTYHKYPKEAWPESEFVETSVRFPRGEEVSMKLAERGAWIGDRKKGCWVREVRKLTGSGHQTSVIGSCYSWTAPKEEAAWLFSRWSQENFFRYAMGTLCD